jgi:hypothetical protein
MNRRGTDLDPELEAFVTPRKIERRMPAALRARVLARARATAAGEEISPAQPPQARPVPGARRRRLFRIALVASFAVAGAAVGAVAALHGRGARTPEVGPDRPPAPRVAVTNPGSPTTEPPPSAAGKEPARPSRLAHAGAKSDPFTAELGVLQRAQVAYTHRDFSAALALVAEHARRFPRGRLAEQREALRVRSLLGAGRTDEAHRAAAAFAVRFPRSVLLPRVAEESESSER